MFVKPEKSPWGDIRDCDLLCPGMFLVTTSAHGGTKEAFEENINQDIRKYHPDYWRTRQAGRENHSGVLSNLDQHTVPAPDYNAIL